MNKEEYAIFPGQIKINNCTYFGLDYELTDFVNHLAEQNQKCKEVIDKLNFIKNRKNQGASQENINKMAIEFVNSYLKEVSE